jgi:hypothetical protein
MLAEPDHHAEWLLTTLSMGSMHGSWRVNVALQMSCAYQQHMRNLLTLSTRGVRPHVLLVVHFNSCEPAATVAGFVYHGVTGCACVTCLLHRNRNI